MKSRKEKLNFKCEDQGQQLAKFENVGFWLNYLMCFGKKKSDKETAVHGTLSTSTTIVFTKKNLTTKKLILSGILNEQ